MSNFLANIFSGGKFRELEEQVENLLSENTELQKEIQSQESNSELLKTYSKELQQKSKDLDVKNQELAKTNSEKQKLEQELAKATSVAKEKDSEISKLNVDLDSLRKTNEEYEQTISSKKEEIATAKASIQKLEEKIVLVEQESRDNESAIANLRTDLLTSYDQNDELKEIISSKMEEIASMSSAKLKLEENLSEAEQDIKIKDKTICDLQAEIMSLREHIEEIENEDNTSDLNAENFNELHDRIEVLVAENLKLIDEIQSWERKNHDLQIINSNLESAIDFYKKEIDDLRPNITKVDDNGPETVENGGTTEDVGIENHYGADTLTIDKVIDVETGNEIDTREFFNKSVDEIFHTRRELQDAIIFKKPKYICKYCGQMVKISGRNTARGKASFFSHLYDSDECDFKTTTGLSEALINARKYGKYGESDRHKENKEWIISALKDEVSVSKGIADVQKEKTVFGLHPLFKWRRPDVYCRYKDIEIVFELQLSTTFASVIAERECFYKMNKIFLIWVFNFAENEEHVDLRNMMMKDIYMENQRNVFVIDREARQEGLRRRELVLKCDWLESNGLWHYSGADNYGSKGEFVTLSDLKYNTKTYKPYYHEITNSNVIETSDDDSEKTKEVLRLLDGKYELIKKQQEHEEEKKKLILAALDVDSVDKTYKSVDAWIVKKGKYFGVYNYVSNKEILPTEYLSIKLWSRKKYFVAEDEHYKFTIFDRFGKEVLKHRYDSIPSLEDGSAIVQKSENGIRQWVIISYAEDKVKESKSYSRIEKVSNNEYFVTKETDGAFFKGLISTNGNIQISTSYTQLCVFGDNLYHAVKNGKHGIIDGNERIRLPFIYDKIGVLQDGKAEISKDESRGHIDSNGRPVFSKVITLDSKSRHGKQQEKCYFLNKWWLFNYNKNPWKKGYDEICHYQGKVIAFYGNEIEYFNDISADRSCGIQAVLKEKNKNGLLFAIGSRIVKMNKRQLNKKPEDVLFEIGQTYSLYISCIKTDLDLVYVSPVPCFGPTLKKLKRW